MQHFHIFSGILFVVLVKVLSHVLGVLGAAFGNRRQAASATRLVPSTNCHTSLRTAGQSPDHVCLRNASTSRLSLLMSLKMAARFDSALDDSAALGSAGRLESPLDSPKAR